MLVRDIWVSNVPGVNNIGEHRGTTRRNVRTAPPVPRGEKKPCGHWQALVWRRPQGKRRTTARTLESRGLRHGRHVRSGGRTPHIIFFNGRGKRSRHISRI